MDPPQSLTFDGYTLDMPNEQLWQGNQVILLRSKAFMVLRYLVEHAGQLVTKAELFAALWPDTVVSDGALTFCIVELRKALGDNAKAPRFIETVHRRGYRFLPTVTASPVVSSQSAVVSSEEGARGWRRETRPLPLPASSLKSLASPIVGRESDLAFLHERLAKALRGERQIVFVTGEAGIGKTTLLEAFVAAVRDQEQRQKAKQAVGCRLQAEGPPQFPPFSLQPTALSLSQPPTPWISWGQCIEQYGPGEPYMPFLEALGRLCREPPGDRLIELLTQHAPTWLVQMPTLLTAPELETLQRKTAGATRERMLRELGEAIDVITAERPLVVVLEDLQWSDVSTLELLTLLARRHEPARLLVIGTYRPVDVIVQEHPLRAVKQELQLHGLCAELPPGLLSEAQVAEYLTMRFNADGGAQRTVPLQKLARVIHRRTDGNPLFMVTAVEDLVSQGMLISGDGQGTLPEDLATVARRVPDSLQQLIEQQIEQLGPEDRQILEVASVAGMEFSAVTVAAGVETETEIVEEHCAELARQARFLRASGAADWPDGTVTERYNFLHALYQEVLYNRVTPARRRRLHQRIAERAEHIYGERAREIAAELAVHFAQGHDYGKAVQYLQQAGENALRRSANREAIAHLTTGLELLKTLPETPERCQQELTLQVTLSAPLVITQGFSAQAVKATYDRALELCRELGETPQHFFVLFGLSRFYIVRSEFRTASALDEQLLRLADMVHDPTLLFLAYMRQSGNLFFQGKFAQVHSHAEQGMALYDVRQQGALIFLYGEDPAVSCLTWAATALWYLGYPAQALERIYQALHMAQTVAHPLGVTFSLFWTAFLHQCRGEVQRVQEQTDTLLARAQELENPQYFAGIGLRGWVLTAQGCMEEGAAQIQQGLAALRAIGQELGRPYFSALLAAAYSKAGHVAEGMQVLTEALDFIYKTGECMHQAELYRLYGELTLQEEKQKAKSKGRKAKVTDPQSPTPNPQTEAEACFLKAIEIARKQQAKSLELRSVMSLSRLWRNQGKKDEARQMLSNIYGWFTEGFDTKDLQEAKALLEELH